MRYRDIIAEQIGDTWETRHAAAQRKEAKRTKAVKRLATVQRRAADQARTAAAQRARSNDQIADAQRDLAEPT